MRTKALIGSALAMAVVAAGVAVVADSIKGGRAGRVETTVREKEVGRDRLRGPDLQLWTNAAADVVEVRRILDASKHVERYAVYDVSRATPPGESLVWVDLDWNSARNPALPLMDELGDMVTLDFTSKNIEAVEPSEWREWDLLVLIDAHTSSEEVEAIEERIAGDDRVSAYRHVSSRESSERIRKIFGDTVPEQDEFGPAVYVRVRDAAALDGLVADLQAINHVSTDGLIVAPRYRPSWFG